MNNFKTIFPAQSSNVSNSEQILPCESWKLVLQALGDAPTKEHPKRRSPVLRVLGYSEKNTLPPCQTCVERGASTRDVGTFTVRE